MLQRAEWLEDRISEGGKDGSLCFRERLGWKVVLSRVVMLEDGVARDDFFLQNSVAEVD